MPAALQVAAGTGPVHQDPAHEPGRNRKKMGPILPFDPGQVDQPDVRLMDKSGGLQAMILPFPKHVPMGQPAQFTVDERHQLV